MSCFKLPESLYDDLEKMMTRFLWDQQKEERKLHWASWRKLCKKKREGGGMGFKNVSIHYEAVLAKQGCEQESLLHKILKARYLPNSSFFDSKLR